MALHNPVSRHLFLKSSGLLLGAPKRCHGQPSYVQCMPAYHPPQLEQGIQIGDVRANRAVIWSRSDRPARLLVGDVSEHFVKLPACADRLRPRRPTSPLALT